MAFGFWYRPAVESDGSSPARLEHQASWFEKTESHRVKDFDDDVMMDYKAIQSRDSKKNNKQQLQENDKKHFF